MLTLYFLLYFVKKHIITDNYKRELSKYRFYDMINLLDSVRHIMGICISQKEKGGFCYGRKYDYII